MGVKLIIYFLFSFFIFLKSFSQIDDDFRLKSDSTQISFFNKDNSSSQDYHIALLLPFCLEKNDILLNEKSDSLAIPNFYKKTQISIDFYLGFLSSLNEFENFNITVSVFDIKEGDL